MRPAVKWFAQQMETKLRENDHKGGWMDCDYLWLIKRLKDEVEELERELHPTPCNCRGFADCDHMTSRAWFRPNKERTKREAADVANFAMMIATVVSGENFGGRGIEETSTGEGGTNPK